MTGQAPYKLTLKNANPDFDISVITSEYTFSNMPLYRRLKDLTGTGLSQLIDDNVYNTLIFRDLQKKLEAN